jgi:hypothetical protein
MYALIDSKRRAARYLHAPPLLVERAGPAAIALDEAAGFEPLRPEGKDRA